MTDAFIIQTIQRPSGHSSDQHLFPYMGIVDWDRFVKGLKEIGYRSVLSFETFNALNVYPPEVHPEALKLLAAIGRDFSRRIEEA